MSNEEIISQALTLPLADRLFIVNQIVESINPMDNKIDKLWIAESKRRVEAIKNGSLKTVSYGDVFTS